MIRRLAKLRWLTPADRRLLAEAVLSLGVMRLALWCLPFRIWSALAAPSPKAAAESRPEPARISWAVTSASRLVPGATCLVRALSGRRILANHGYAAIVRIGVSRSPAAGFEAHAWLEHEGRVLAGNVSGPFTPILSL